VSKDLLREKCYRVNFVRPPRSRYRLAVTQLSDNKLDSTSEQIIADLKEDQLKLEQLKVQKAKINRIVSLIFLILIIFTALGYWIILQP